MSHKATLESVLRRVIPVTESGCWLWEGSENQKGYGQCQVNGRLRRVHRYIYEEMRGPIPVGLESDHLCRVRCCCNPDHLEFVTHRVNVLRGLSPGALHAVKTHCPQGHPYTGRNLILAKRKNGRVARICRICHALDMKKRYDRNN